MNFGVVCLGWFFGIVMGTNNGQVIVRRKLKALLENGEIKVTDSNGNELASDQLISLLSARRKKG